MKTVRISLYSVLFFWRLNPAVLRIMLLTLVLSGLSLPLLSAQNSLATLYPNKALKGWLNLASREESRRYRITVPDNAYSLTIRMESSQRSLELALYDSEAKPLITSQTNERVETLSLDRITEPLGLHSGSYEVEVFLGPNIPDWEREMTAFSLVAELIIAPNPSPITVNSTIKDTLQSGKGMFQIYEYQVPQGVDYCRVDLFDDFVDLDLFILANPNPNPDKAIRASRRRHGTEFLTIAVNDLPHPANAKNAVLYIMVLAPWDFSPQSYSLRLGHGREPPDFLAKLPELKTNNKGLARAVGATVELFSAYGSGSGCLINASGIILTNRHVIVDADDNVLPYIEVAMCLSPSQPAKLLFEARVIEQSKERDIALLKISTSFYGTSLPSNYQFPYLEAGNPEQMQLGDPLQFLGYPGIGSLDSRASITYTRGVLAGFQRSPYGSLIKTDAEINSGSSGGACLDQNYRLIGLPTQVIGEGGGQLAYITTIASLPDSWKSYLSFNQR